MLEARIGLAPAREQALRDAIPTYLRRAVREHDVDLIATPEVEITEGPRPAPVGLRRHLRGAARDHRAAATAGCASSCPTRRPTDDEVDEARRAPSCAGTASSPTSTARRLAATSSPSTSPPRRDGEEVAGLNTEDWSYEIGQGWVADDFDDQLVGASAGDELTFTTTPKGTAEPADFSVTVTRVQELVLPELDRRVGRRQPRRVRHRRRVARQSIRERHRRGQAQRGPQPAGRHGSPRPSSA